MKTRKYFLALLLTTAYMIMPTPVCAWEYRNPLGALPYSGGMGTKDAPFIINNAQELADLSWYVNHGDSYEGAWFALGRDINLNEGFTFGDEGVEGSGKPNEWMPIGYKNSPFMGSFDGRGHTISGLYFTAPELHHDMNSLYYYAVGLFGAICKSDMKDVVIKNSLININIQDDAEKAIDAGIGFLVGYLDEGNVSGCKNYSPIKVIYDDRDDGNVCSVGGLIGGWYYSGNDYLLEFTLADCANYGNLSLNGRPSYAAGQLGGIAGCLNPPVNIGRCVNYGKISSTYLAAGLVAKQDLYGSSITDCHNHGTVDGEAGLIGYARTKTVANCTNTGEIKRGSGLFSECLATSLSHLRNSGNALNGSGIANYCYAESMVDCHNEGEVYGGAGLLGGGMYLTDMHDCSNTGAVVGKAGLIGEMSETHVVMTNCFNSGHVTGMGGLASEGLVSFVNCYNTGDVTGQGRVAGGLIGSVDDRFASGDIFISQCYNSGNITLIGENNSTLSGLGGLVGSGSLMMSITDSHNSGNVAYEGENAPCMGGIAGIVGGLLKRVWNSGNITSGGSRAGGLVGAFAPPSRAENVYNAGKVCGTDNVAGLFGHVSSITLNYAHNYGEVVGNGLRIGQILCSPEFEVFETEVSAVSHCYSLSGESIKPMGGYDWGLGGFEQKSREEFGNGTVCRLLNDVQNPTPWGQEVATQAYPVLDGTGNPDVSGIAAPMGKGEVPHAVYTVSGVKVPVGKASSSALDNGVYVVGGKKIIISNK